MVTLLKVTSCECWGKAQSQVSIRKRKYYVSDQMTQQVKYVLCHSNKKSCNEYKHTVPKVATLIDKTNLVIKKKKRTTLKIQKRKTFLFSIHLYHSPNTYQATILLRQCVRCGNAVVKRDKFSTIMEYSKKWENTH